MNYKEVVRVVSIALVLALMLTLGAGYAQGEERPDWLIAETITIIDAAGREVTITKPIERIVSGHVLNSEAVKLLGAWDRVVGRDLYTADEILFPGASELPVCRAPIGYYNINFEKVLELKPDIFLTLYLPGAPGFEELIDKLEPEISVVFLNFENPVTLVENIRKLGLILDKEKEAEEYIAFYERVVNDIREKTAGLSEGEKTQVFLWTFNYDYQEKYMGVGKFPGIQAQFDIVGAKNICGDLSGMFPYLDPEWLIGQDIDVIACWVSPAVIPDIFGYGIDDPGEARETRDWIMNADKNLVLAGSDAVKNKRVYLYQTELAGSPRFVVALAYMAKWFHPELFSDLDPQAIHQEYLTRFMRIDYDLNKHGVLFYLEPPKTVTITDAAGREVTITLPVERIAFTHYSMAEGLKIVGAWDRVVGRDGYSLDPIIYPNIDELPPVVQPTNCYAVNYEKVFELRPDIFLAAYIPMPGFEEMVAKLEPDIPVVALNLWDPDTIEENFRKLGLILDAEDEAEEFLDFYGRVETNISAVTSKLSEEDKPRVFHKTGWGNVADLMSYSNDLPGFPFRNETAGSINTAADLPSMGGWIQNVDPEWLVEQDPDIVVDNAPFPGVFGLGVDDTSAVEPIRNAIMELDVFSGGTAVRNGDVYLMSPDFFGSPRYIVGLTYQAKWFHPDLFADLDPQAIHQEYLTRFMRIDYDLSKHSVFVYPEP